ncbi:MAG: RidA family protein [Acidimicrobiales bacterium]
MTISEVRSSDLNQPLGRFSQAIKVSAPGDLLFISGLTSRDPDGNVIGEGDIKVQTETILENMTKLLAEAGGSMADVVKVTVFIRDMELFDQIHEVRARYFREPYPASSMVEVSRLVSPQHLIEIEGVAVLGQSPSAV